MEKILVVDDEDSLREILQRFLARLGYKVDLAESGEQAIEILQKQAEEYALIITDLNMPGMDGTALCEHIRKMNTTSVVYALSAYVSSYETDNLEAVGFDGYLCKPVNSQTLQQAIEGALNKYRRRADKSDGSVAANL